jgi:hypothetical protein
VFEVRDFFSRNVICLKHSFGQPETNIIQKGERGLYESRMTGPEDNKEKLGKYVQLFPYFSFTIFKRIL